MPKVQVDIVVSKIPVRDVLKRPRRSCIPDISATARSSVYDVENVVKVRTGEEGYDALQDVE